MIIVGACADGGVRPIFMKPPMPIPTITDNTISRSVAIVPDTDRRQEVLALSYPTEEILLGEYTEYIAVLEKHGIEVLLADTAAAYSFDYSC